MLVQLGMVIQLALELLKIKNTYTLLLILLIWPKFCSGQNEEYSTLLHTQSKINLELIGMSFRKETPVNKRMTSILNAGLQYSFVITSGNVIKKYYSSLDAVVSYGVRYYYTISEKTKYENLNVGKFFQMDAGVKSGSLISRNMYYPAYVFLRPHWGMQFATSQKMSMEFCAGLTIGSSIIEGYKEVAVAPNIQLRLGYIINHKKSTCYVSEITFFIACYFFSFFINKLMHQRIRDNFSFN